MMNLKKYISLAVLPMVFTACQEDTLVENQTQGIYTLKATVDQADPMGRAQVVLGGTSTTTEKFHWNVGDKMTVLDVSNVEDISQHSFTISSEYDGISPSADFTTTNALTQGNPIVAIYPSTFELDSEYGYFIHMNVAGNVLEDNSEASWIKYFSKNMFMMATGTASEGMGIDMQHLCSLIRVTYTNATEDDVQIKSINLKGDICTNRTFHAGDTSYDAGLGSDAINGVTFTNPVTVASGESEDFYILTFAYFDKENAEWGGLTGFDITYADDSGVSSPSTYNGEEFVISNLNPGSAYWLNVAETNDGFVWTKDATVTFSNKELSLALYNVLGTEKVSFDADSCAVMNLADVHATTSLFLGWKDYTISSLSGIEHFVNLEEINCCNTNLVECDLSKNKALIVANVSNNSTLKSVNVSGLDKLKVLSSSFCESLTSLDITGCSNLWDLSIEGTSLESLELENPGELGRLSIGNTKLYNYDLSIFTELEGLNVCNMNFSLDMIPAFMKPQLNTLYCDDNNLTELDLSQFPNLQDLHCHRNNIKELDLAAAPKLNSLMCMENQIENLNISHWNDIGHLSIGNQQNNIVLNLTMTETQKTEWDENWGKGSENANVTVIVTSGEKE